MWKEELAIGVDRLDTQHKELFRSMGAIQKSMQKTVRASDYRQLCMNALYSLKNYIKQHFPNEESYMESMGYAGLDDHKVIHEGLAKEVADFEEKVMQSDYDSGVIRTSLDGLMAKYAHHIVHEDQKIPKSLDSSQSGLTAIKNVAAAKQARASGQYADNLLDDVAIKAEGMLKNMGDFGNIRTIVGTNTIVESEICFKVNLVGEINKSLGFIYSRGVALEVYRSATGSETVSVNDMVLSALAEISCLIAGKVSDTIAAGGTQCDIEAPTTATWDSFPESAQHVMISTRVGEVAILLFDTK